LPHQRDASRLGRIALFENVIPFELHMATPQRQLTTHWKSFRF